jgi:putative transposase
VRYNRAVRHPLHDYQAPAGYMVAFATYKRLPLLGRIVGDAFEPFAAGLIVRETWRTLPDYFPGLQLDAFQLMPDHVHAILILTDPSLCGQPDARFRGLPQVMQAFKGMSARALNRAQYAPGRKVWQEGYHDRVIRNERELDKYRFYVQTNPQRAMLKRKQ